MALHWQYISGEILLSFHPFHRYNWQVVFLRISRVVVIYQSSHGRVESSSMVIYHSRAHQRGSSASNGEVGESWAKGLVQWTMDDSWRIIVTGSWGRSGRWRRWKKARRMAPADLPQVKDLKGVTLLNVGNQDLNIFNPQSTKEADSERKVR